MWRNWARNSWEVTNLGEPGQDEFELTFTHDKANDIPYSKAIGYQVKFTDTPLAVTFEKGEAARVEAVTRRMSYRSRIIEALKGGAMTLDQLKDEIDLGPRITSPVLSRNKGLFTQVERGVWGLRTE
jgi:hypothetical protein